MVSKSSFPKVLFVIPAFFRNGAVDFYVNLAEELVLLNINVEIIAIKDQEFHSRLPKEPVTIKVVLDESQSTRKRLIKVIIQLLQSVLSSDIIILGWENGPALWLPSLLAYIIRKPTLAIVQNNIQKSLLDYPSLFGRRILRWAYSQTEAIVCASKALITAVETEVNHHKKIISISNGINVERIRALAKLSSPLKLTVNNLPIVVGIGRLVPQKGFDLLIQSHAAVLKGGIYHQLVLIGDGEEQEASTLAKLSANLGVSDTVSFLGYLTNPYPVLAQASLFCLSSRYEGFGLVVAEAATLGIPVIATDCLAGPREILVDGLYGDLVQVESVEALSCAIEKHFQNPQRLVSKAQASAQQTDRFSIKTCAQKYSDLISSLLFPD